MNKKQTIKLNESQLRQVIKESIKKVLKEHEDDWFSEQDTAYIGRTEAYYDENDDYIFTPDLWTYSNNPNDEDFAGEVFELTEEGKEKLNWWIRCCGFNEYRRKHAFNPNMNTPEQEWNILTKKYGKLIRQ